MGGVFDDYVIREDPDYTELLGELGAEEGISLEQFRKALAFTFHILKNDPHVFPAVGMTDAGPIRLVKTELLQREEFRVPPLQISFIVWEDERVVTLLKIEKRQDTSFIQ